MSAGTGIKNFDEEYTAINPETFDEYRVSRNERAAEPPEQRQFVIGGETFVRRVAVSPYSLLRWSQMISREVSFSEADALDVVDETVLAFLEPGQDEKWRNVRRPDAPNPITLTDMNALIRWLVAENAGRPTGPSSPSLNGAGGTGGGTATTSTDGSGSLAAPAPTG